MASINEQMLDKLIGHDIDLSRLSNGQVLEIVKILNSGDAKVRQGLIDALEALGDNYSQSAVDKALAGVYAENDSVFEKIRDALALLILGVVGYEIAYQRKLLISLIPESVQEKYKIAGASEENVAKKVADEPFQGRQIDQWVDGLKESRKSGISAAIRNGILSGLSAAAIVTAIMGTRVEKYANGDLNKYRNQLEAIVVSAVALAALTAKETVTEANSELIRHLEWVSVLDGRTTTTCIIRSGKPYTIGTFKPIGHKVPWLAGPGKIHFRCRSSYVIVFKSAKELGIDDENVRAIMDGKAPEHVNYAQWLDRQSAERQDEILGPTRGKMLREGKIKVSGFFNDRGKFLTLEELRARITD